VGAAVIRHADWQTALERAANAALQGLDGTPDLAFLFASSEWQDQFDEMVPRARAITGARVVLGASGPAVIGPESGSAEEPALALMALSVPGAVLHAAHLAHDALAACRTTDDLRRLSGAPLDDVRGWLVFADPTHLDVEGLLNVLASAYPGVPIVGGVASAPNDRPPPRLFLADRTYGDGATCVAIGGAYGLHAVVSGGCFPVGDAWTITGVEGNLITGIANLPAYELLRRTYDALGPELQAHARRNLAVGFAIDEYRESFRRGDFVVRSLDAVDRGRGSLAIGGTPRVGQTVQFHVRDMGGERELDNALARALADLGDRRPLGAVLCADAHYRSRTLAPLPLAGLRCQGVIGSVGRHTHVHGFAACAGLIVPAADGD
jgi:small ligand-binding sensory domain FIST